MHPTNIEFIRVRVPKIIFRTDWRPLSGGRGWTESRRAGTVPLDTAKTGASRSAHAPATPSLLLLRVAQIRISAERTLTSSARGWGRPPAGLGPLGRPGRG